MWSSSLTKPDLLRFSCSSGPVLSKVGDPQFFYISYITNSSSFNDKIFRKKSMLEKFRANVLKEVPLIVSAHPYCARKFTCYVIHERIQMTGQTAIARALSGFNDLGRSVTQFFFR